jgi:hypothetical protein
VIIGNQITIVRDEHRAGAANCGNGVNLQAD